MKSKHVFIFAKGYEAYLEFLDGDLLINYGS